MKSRGLLLAAAIFGLLVPNNLFLYAWLHAPAGGGVMQNPVAAAFMLDAFLSLGLLACFFSVRPIGPVKWYWFVLLSLVGGLAFGIPWYWWLNDRKRSSPRE